MDASIKSFQLLWASSVCVRLSSFRLNVGKWCVSLGNTKVIANSIFTYSSKGYEMKKILNSLYFPIIWRSLCSWLFKIVSPSYFLVFTFLLIGLSVTNPKVAASSIFKRRITSDFDFSLHKYSRFLEHIV